MDRKATVSVFAVCAALLAVTIALVAFLAPESNARFKDGATALVFITGAAVAIERGIEARSAPRGDEGTASAEGPD